MKAELQTRAGLIASCDTSLDTLVEIKCWENSFFHFRADCKAVLLWRLLCGGQAVPGQPRGGWVTLGSHSCPWRPLLNCVPRLSEMRGQLWSFPGSAHSWLWIDLPCKLWDTIRALHTGRHPQPFVISVFCFQKRAGGFFLSSHARWHLLNAVTVSFANTFSVHILRISFIFPYQRQWPDPNFSKIFEGFPEASQG